LLGSHCVRLLDSRCHTPSNPTSRSVHLRGRSARQASSWRQNRRHNRHARHHRTAPLAEFFQWQGAGGKWKTVESASVHSPLGARHLAPTWLELRRANWKLASHFVNVGRSASP
jgi:hypothetical protein